MLKNKILTKLKENFYRRIDKNDELQFLDSSTLNHALCLEIAEFALFLASDKSRMITGAIHAVDSGYTAFKGKMELFDQITS